MFRVVFVILLALNCHHISSSSIDLIWITDPIPYGAPGADTPATRSRYTASTTDFWQTGTPPIAERCTLAQHDIPGHILAMKIGYDSIEECIQLCKGKCDAVSFQHVSRKCFLKQKQSHVLFKLWGVDSVDMSCVIARSRFVGASTAPHSSAEPVYSYTVKQVNKEPIWWRELSKALDEKMKLFVERHLIDEIREHDNGASLTSQCLEHIQPHVKRMVQCAYDTGYRPAQCNPRDDEGNLYLLGPDRKYLTCYWIENLLEEKCSYFKLPCDFLKKWGNFFNTNPTDDPMVFREREGHSNLNTHPAKCSEGKYDTEQGCLPCSDTRQYGTCFTPDLDCQVADGRYYEGAHDTVYGLKCHKWPYIETGLLAARGALTNDEDLLVAREDLKNHLTAHCRNYNGDNRAEGVWCYIVPSLNPNIGWGFCDVPRCPKKYNYYCQERPVTGQHKYDGNSQKRDPARNPYRGRKDVAISGKSCLNWLAVMDSLPDSMAALGIGDHNFCRAVGKGQFVSCFTLNLTGLSPASPTLEKCDVEFCDNNGWEKVEKVEKVNEDLDENLDEAESMEEAIERMIEIVVQM